MLLIKIIYLLGLGLCFTVNLANAAGADPVTPPLTVDLELAADTVDLGGFLEAKVTVKNVSDAKIEIPELKFDYRSISFAFPEGTPGSKSGPGKLYTQIGHQNGAFLPIGHFELAPGGAKSATFKIPTCKSGKASVQAVFRAGPGQVLSSPAAYTVAGEGKEVVCRMETTQGEMLIRFFPDLAFNHVMHFINRVQEGKYDGLLFHRVIKGFMIQGGDPLGTGMGGPGYVIPQEFNDTPHTPGILSMARTNDPNSAGCQFFICHGTPAFLNGQYTVFGKVFKGLDTVNKIATVTTDANDRPLTDQKMISLKIEAIPVK